MEWEKMTTTTFTEFRKNAKTFFEEVKKGKRVRILRRGKPIADLVPPSDVRSSRSWKRSGLRLVVKGVSLSEEILKEREESRS
jgi:antitoxin (DNA-binding transcriptional repressor) of toxin-antitoxin stability system